jgi:hypothetical protein
MAASVKVGTFNINTSTGNQSITGVGFTPKAVIFSFFREGLSGSDQFYEHSFGVATSSSQRWAWASDNCNYCDQCGSLYDTTKCISIINIGTVQTAADFVSHDADGFTINVTTAEADTRTIHYIAIGGDDVSAFAGTFDSNTSTGNQSATGVGFQPKAVLFAHGPKNTTGAAITNRHQLGLGAAVSSSSRWSTYYIGTNSVTSNEQGLQVTDKCIVSTSTALAIDEAADFVSHDSDGFTVNWTTKSATAIKIGYLALGGTAQYALGTITQPTTTGSQSVTGLAFQPVGELFVSQMKAASASATDHSGQMVGAAVSSSEELVAELYSQNGVDVTGDPDALTSTTACIQAIAGAGTALATADFTSQNSDGFTVNWSAADAVQREICYLAIGSAAAGGGGPSTPTEYGYTIIFN